MTLILQELGRRWVGISASVYGYIVYTVCTSLSEIWFNVQSTHISIVCIVYVELSCSYSARFTSLIPRLSTDVYHTVVTFIGLGMSQWEAWE